MLPALLWITAVLLPIRERTQPDHLELGQWTAGARVEISARFLTGTGPNRLDEAIDTLINQLPDPLQAWANRVHPRTYRRARQRGLDPATLRPEVTVPPWVALVDVNTRQNTNWNDGAPFVDVRLRLDTAVPGHYAGAVCVRLGRREASLPMSFEVRPARSGGCRRLIVDSPFNASSTESGDLLRGAARLLSTLSGSTDVLERLPGELGSYAVLLLADEGLVRLTIEERERVWAFVRKGGRLILSCNAFMAGSVPQANEFLVPHGLKVVDRDQIRQVVVTNIPPGALTVGVRRLEFFRPSLVRVTDPGRAGFLAVNADGDGGYAAVTRPPEGGEIVVLGVSLWWAWVHQFAESSDNGVLLRNLLEADRAAPGGS